MAIGKREIANDVSKILCCNKRHALQAVEAVFESLRENIIQGNHIEIRGFGSFDVKNAKPKPYARNPRTGEIVYVPAHRKATFKISKFLKKEITQAVTEK